MRPSGRILWQPREDALLHSAVEERRVRGEKLRWVRLADGIPFRSAKQCRERWRNHLDPAVRNPRGWTEEEDSLLASLVLARGTKWASFSRRREFEGRSDNSLKNRYAALSARGRLSPREPTEAIREAEDDPLIDSIGIVESAMQLYEAKPACGTFQVRRGCGPRSAASPRILLRLSLPTPIDFSFSAESGQCPA